MAETVVDVDIASADGAPSAGVIEQWVRRTLEAAGSSSPGTNEVAVRIVDEQEMRSMNHDFRGKDRPTNVLAFPAGDGPTTSRRGHHVLGDIAICAPIVTAEAAEQGKPVADHWAHLVVHGVLHLLGYDHVADADAAAMEAQEVRILSAHGIPDPYTGQ